MDEGFSFFSFFFQGQEESVLLLATKVQMGSDGYKWKQPPEQDQDESHIQQPIP